MPESARSFSITHHHLLGVIATTLKRRGAGTGPTVRILDVGCGRGTVIEFLHGRLKEMFPGRAIELHGFDIVDAKVQKSDFFAHALERLSGAHPDVEWGARLSIISSTDLWPYPDDHFDFVISNQVLEHVREHQRLFASITRVLHPDGLSAHLFPLSDAWIEWHLKMPFVHWITNVDVLEWWIRAGSRLGLGMWKKYCRVVEPIPLDEFARMNRDFMSLETNHLAEDDIVRYTKRVGLKYSFRYTDDLYANRLRMALGHPLTYNFPLRGALGARLRFIAYRRISTICLIFEKDNSYVNRGLHDPGL